ncbi:MAG: metallophosphoesterase [Bacteroidales bacterium]|nr:metallophosphoesterase [Bacteroidales bacterium]
MQKFIYTAIILVAMVLTGCDRLDMVGMLHSSGTHVEDRVGEWLAWNDQHGMVEIVTDCSEYQVYVTSDIHITDSAPRVAMLFDRLYADTSAIFCIINGDIANESGEDPFRALYTEIRQPRHRPSHAYSTTSEDTCFVCIGNHDIYFDCQSYFQQYFHTSTYTVTVKTPQGNDLFIFMDSGNATHGAKQLVWLKDVLSHRSNYRNVVLNTHTSLFRNSYDYTTTPAANFPEQENWEFLRLLNDYDVTLCLTGHWHHREEHIIGNVMCVMTDNLNEDEETPNFLRLMMGENVEYVFSNLTKEYEF